MIAFVLACVLVAALGWWIGRSISYYYQKVAIHEMMLEKRLHALKSWYTVQRHTYPKLAPIVAEAINELENDERQFFEG